MPSEQEKTTMQLTLRSHDDFLLATAAGPLSLNELLRLSKNIVDTAREWGFDQVLVDCSAVAGELSDMERYEIGKTLAEYCLSKSMYPKVAMIGKPPAIDGFGAQVASNRGLTVRVFSESRAAMKWLSAFGSKPTAL